VQCSACLLGSILSSLYNELVLAPVHHANQDTNDKFLANIQRNGESSFIHEYAHVYISFLILLSGTFSVVPRVPGGEVGTFFLFVGRNSRKIFRLRQTNSLFSDKSQINVGCSCCCMFSTHSHYTGRQVVHQDYRRVSASYCAGVTCENLRFTVPDSASTSLGLISKISQTFGRNLSLQGSKVDMLMV
jgi:hypothetical protein